MPRALRMPAAKKAATTPDQEFKNEVLDGLEGLKADPKPAAAKRPPGRPRGSKNAPAKATPRNIIGRSTATGKTMSRSQMVDAVATEIYAFLTLAVGGWSLRDPECADLWMDDVNVNGRTQERLEAIADQFAAIIGRSDKLLATMAEGGIIVNIGVLTTLLAKPVKAIFKAHGPGGHNHQAEEGDAPNYDQFQAPALA